MYKKFPEDFDIITFDLERRTIMARNSDKNISGLNLNKA
jgi:hypothetical protein